MCAQLSHNAGAWSEALNHRQVANTQWLNHAQIAEKRCFTPFWDPWPNVAVSHSTRVEIAPAHDSGIPAQEGEIDPKRSVDLERREDRYIIFVRDTRELFEDLSKFTRELKFPETPVTRTVYFGDNARGLPPGLSIKARTYDRDRVPGRWDLEPTSMFDLLELKRTVEVDEKGKRHLKQRKKKKKAKGKLDQMVEILRLSGSILDRTTYKSKHRQPKVKLQEVMNLIDNPPLVRDKIDQALYVHLLETVHPLEDYRWLPLIGTEYERTHFVTKDPAQNDVFRATLDKRVTHYSFFRHGEGFVGVPVGIEDFSRFEVKADHEKLANTDLGEWLDDIILKFRAFRIPSKKYRGLTLRSRYMIQREGLRDEVPGQRLFAEFLGRPVRYKDHEHYINLARYLQSSKTFHLYHDEPRLIEDHEHYVSGRQKGLLVRITGSSLEYIREQDVVATKPTVLCADRVPVSHIPLTSRGDLDEAGIAKLKDRATYYVRLRGFLVENRKSGRVYKVGLERRTSDENDPEYYVIVEYVGRARGRPRFNEAAIIADIGMLYRFLRKDPLLKGNF
jgi:hypothetical protein